MLDTLFASPRFRPLLGNPIAMGVALVLLGLALMIAGLLFVLTAPVGVTVNHLASSKKRKQQR